MAITLKLTFPAGRYHATPWGRHVNEGVPEWPPSPWRLLRAMIAVWKRTCTEVPESTVRKILEPMLRPPKFHLPDHRVAHTRHYMPWEKKGPADRTLIFDTFVAVDKESPLFIGWPEAEIAPEERAILSRILENMSFLGRAEGWVEAKLANEAPTWNCAAADADERNSVPVFCPDPNEAFSDEHYPVHEPGKLKKGLKLEELLFDCPRWHLCLDTQTIHGERWPRVPGGTWIDYTRPSSAPVMKVQPRRNTRASPTVAKFIIDGPVLPLVTDTILVAEAFRRAAMGRFGRWCRDHVEEAEQFRRHNSPEQFASPVLSGKDGDGQILNSPEHAYYLPTAEGDFRRITHVTVFARNGFGVAEIAALRSLCRLDVRELDGLRTQLIGLSEIADAADPAFGNSAVWSSATPFLGPDHIGVKHKARYMRKALSRTWRRLAEQVPGYNGVELREIEELPAGGDGGPRSYEFRRTRSKHRSSGYRVCGNFRLVFSRSIQGPLCLGYGSHFGLGMFKAEP